MSYVGKKNVYLCRACGYPTVTVDRDEGTTPMVITCRRPSGCDGSAYSQFYKVEDWPLPPKFEWYKPEGKERKRLKEAMRQHFMMGGLLLRPISQDEK